MPYHNFCSDKYDRHLRCTALWYKNATLRVPSIGNKIRKISVKMIFLVFGSKLIFKVNAISIAIVIIIIYASRILESITAKFYDKNSFHKILKLKPHPRISKCSKFAWVKIQCYFFDIVFTFDKKKQQILNNFCMP